MSIFNSSLRIVSVASAAVAALFAAAMPPRPGVIEVAQPDGTTFEARIMGNSTFNYYVRPDGTRMVADPSDGFIRRAAISADGLVVSELARDARSVFTADEFEAAVRATIDSRIAKPVSRVAPAEIRREFPTTGVVRGLIVMAEFDDVKFLPGTTREYVDAKVNQADYSAPETYGSVNDYFRAQSDGRFTPEFDVVGPVTLPHPRAWYGLEEKLDDLFRDAAYGALEQAGVDFTRYDVDNDHFVDFFFVIMPGHSQAQGGPAECVWPAMKDLSDYVSDAFNGMYLGVAACSTELKNGTGTDLDGVATICHEFSHILGLPDVYDAMGTGGYGMGHFDMLCYGPYNDEGRTPCGYTSMEKFTLGWLTPATLDEDATGVTLRDFSTTGDCRFIVNPANPNEYYTLENRQLNGFDSALPGHGLIISYVNYDRALWKKNTLNSPTMSRYEHISIIPADNTRSFDNEASDPWPGTRNVTSFSAAGRHVPVWYSTDTPATFAITDICENADGSVTFNFTRDVAAIQVVDAAAPDAGAEWFSLQGIRVDASALTPGSIYIRRPASGSASKVMVR